MNYAKTRGDIDISSYITTYNAGVTADINTAAATLLTALGRTNVTSSITNPSLKTVPHRLDGLIVVFLEIKPTHHYLRKMGIIILRHILAQIGGVQLVI